MEKIRKVLNHIFIDGLSGMALGLFSTLIIGTIIQQIGQLIGGTVGDTLYLFGKVASAMTSAGIGVGVAYRFKESPLVVISAAIAGMIGAFASKLLAGAVLVEGAIVLAGPGEPLGAFLAAYVGIELGHLVSAVVSFRISTALPSSMTACNAGNPAGTFSGIIKTEN